jgi:two-component system CheB/CheR fusion protein
MEYPCHSPTEQRWFMMSVAPVLGQDGGAVVSHVNISNWYGKVLS